jgi:Ca2+-binding EF-hand superfamily protein
MLIGMRVPREDLMQTIALYDSDRNGELTFDEFVQGYWSGTRHANIHASYATMVR